MAIVVILFTPDYYIASSILITLYIIGHFIIWPPIPPIPPIPHEVYGSNLYFY